MSSHPSSTATARFRTKWLTPTFFDEFHDYWFEGLAPDALMPTEEVIKRWFGRDEKNDAFCRERYGSFLDDAQSTDIAPTELINPIESPRRALLLILLFDQIPRNIFRGQEAHRCFNVFDRIALEISLRSIFPATYRAGQQFRQRSLDSTAPTPTTAEHEPDDTIERWYDHPDITLQREDLDEKTTTGLDITTPQFRHHLGYRMWFYLPLMHSESPTIHEWAKTRYDSMKVDMEHLPADVVEKNRVNGAVITPHEIKALLDRMEGFEIQHRDIIHRFGRYPHRNRPLGRQETREEREYLDDGGLTFGSES